MGFCSSLQKRPRSDFSSQDWLIANLRRSSFLGYYVRNHFQFSKAVRCSRGSEGSLLTTADEPLRLGTNGVAWTPESSYIDDVSDR